MLGKVLDRLGSLGFKVDLLDDWDLPVLLSDARGEGEGRGLRQSFDSCLFTVRRAVAGFFV